MVKTPLNILILMRYFEVICTVFERLSNINYHFSVNYSSLYNNNITVRQYKLICLVHTPIVYLTNVAESFDTDIHCTAFTGPVCPDIPILCLPLLVQI